MSNPLPLSNPMLDLVAAIRSDPNISPELRDIYSMPGKPPKPSPAITEFAMQDAHRLRAALQSIAALDPTATGLTEPFGKETCFEVAQAIAKAALAQETKA